MLSISARGSAREATDYYAHLETDHQAGPEDYYAAEGAGQWYGAGADALGLYGHVTAEVFRLAAEGRAPDGSSLIQGAGPAHRAGWDLTFSAPKSVSVVWAVANESQRDAIATAHDRAIEKALSHIQHDFLLARRGAGGRDREAAKLLFSQFQHGTSREGDMQLHSHAFLHNLAMREDGTWGSIEPREIYKWKMALGAAYRAELAAELHRAGYQIQADGDSFAVAGVPSDVCEHFSRRRAQIEAAMAEHGTSGARAAEVAALDTRQAKNHDLDRDELHALWTAEAAELGFAAHQALAAQAAEDLGPMPTPTELLEAATAMDAVVEERHIFRAVAVAAQHRRLGLDEIHRHVQQVLDSSEIKRLVHRETGEVRYTTRELYTQEREIIAAAEQRGHEDHHAVSAVAVDDALRRFAQNKGFALSPEQQAAVRHVIERAGAVQVVVGDAGTGKSTAMEAARMAWEANGQRVIGAALAGKAAAGLQEDSGIESDTIASLLLRIEGAVDQASGQQRPPTEVLTPRDVIVIDEAGMVDSRTMHRLMSHATQAGARVVLVGDHKQLQAVAAGGVFRHLAERDSARLTDIRRQNEAWAKEAVKEFSRGEAGAALQKFIDRRLVHVAEDQRAAIEQAVSRWHERVQQADITDVVLSANTNAEVVALNQAARDRMNADYRLGLEVQIQLRDQTGRPTGKLAIAEGDRLLAKKNSRALGLKNGDFMVVEKVNFTAAGIEIDARLDRTGEVVRINTDDYCQLRHGYAATVHALQGATAEHSIALAGGTMTSRESTYVQMSRMRQTAEIIATRQQLRDAAEQLPATAKMAQLAEIIAAERGMELPAGLADSFADTRAWLNEHANNQLADHEENPLAELQDLVQAMNQSRAKETTLDYQEYQTAEKTYQQTEEENDQNRSIRGHTDQNHMTMSN